MCAFGPRERTARAALAGSIAAAIAVERPKAFPILSQICLPARSNLASEEGLGKGFGSNF
jgi:hypothetical protein